MLASPVSDLFGLSLNFILQNLRLHQEKWISKTERPPLFVGFNGVQGAGKSFLVRFDGVILNVWDMSCFQYLKRPDAIVNNINLTILSRSYYSTDAIINPK